MISVFTDQFKSPFYPGGSCEDICNKNPESQDKSGYYWIFDGPRYVYCGMNYTGLSCEDNYITIIPLVYWYTIIL